MTLVVPRIFGRKGTIMSTSSNPIARMWRTVVPRRGSVARASDRFQAGLLVFVVLLALAALPVAASFGSETYVRQQGQSAHQLSARTQVTATLRADGPAILVDSRAGVAGNGEPTDATWMLPDGARRVGWVGAARGTLKGESLTIWVDRTVPTVFSLDRLRLAQWQQEWFQEQDRETHS
jgi:type II secretory pathway pseudopilin PulG